MHGTFCPYSPSPFILIHKREQKYPALPRVLFPKCCSELIHPLVELDVAILVPAVTGTLCVTCQDLLHPRHEITASFLVYK